MRVIVRQDHIKKGIRDDPYYCPIGLAVREFTGRIDVRVTGTCIQMGAKALYLPNKAKQWIEKFDQGKKVEPITFSTLRRKNVRTSEEEEEVG